MYQALYRQYRPRTFDEILGQEHISTTLKSQIIKGNIGHAYLFSGTRGTGKTSAAKIFSRAVNCMENTDGNPCNSCPNCLSILEDTEMDIIEMDAASNNSVEDIREIRDKVIYPPNKIKYKVYIIDEVHMLSKGAFNALLKTLEEPPKHLLFILATTEPEKLPQTILSRCQRFDFKRISNENLVLNMKNIVEKIGIKIDDRSLKLIAQNADGAMRDALSLLDQCVSFNLEEIQYEDTIKILGIANKSIIFNIVEDIKEKKLEDIIHKIEAIVKDGKDLEKFIGDLIKHYRNLMIVKSTKNHGSLIDIDDINGYKEQADNMDIDDIIKSIEILTQAESKGKWSSQTRIILEITMIKLINLDEEAKRAYSEKTTYSHRKEGVKATKEINESPKNPGQHVEKRPEYANKEENLVDNKVEKREEKIYTGDSVDFQEMLSKWPEVIKLIKAKKINIYALIMEGRLVSFENNLLTIGYEEGFGFHKEAISSKNNKEFVEEIVSDFFNNKISINFIMKGKLTNQKEEKKTDIKKSIEEVVGFFGEDIVKIK